MPAAKRSRAGPHLPPRKKDGDAAPRSAEASRARQMLEESVLRNLAAAESDDDSVPPLVEDTSDGDDDDEESEEEEEEEDGEEGDGAASEADSMPPLVAPSDSDAASDASAPPGLEAAGDSDEDGDGEVRSRRSRIARRTARRASPGYVQRDRPCGAERAARRGRQRDAVQAPRRLLRGQAGRWQGGGEGTGRGRHRAAAVACLGGGRAAVLCGRWQGAPAWLHT